MKKIPKHWKTRITVTDLEGNAKTIAPDGAIIFAFDWEAGGDNVEVKSIHLGKLAPDVIASHLMHLVADDQPDEEHEETADLWRKTVSDMMDILKESVERAEADDFAREAIDEAEARDPHE